MTTLFTAIFYLWLVLSILLAAMWFLREQDRRRKDQLANELTDVLLSGPQGQEPAPEAEQEPGPPSAEVEHAPDSKADKAADKTLDKPHETELPGILDVLEGITLPHELTPLTARIEDPDRHAIFITPNPDAAEVGTAFADELVAQGFDIQASGFDQAMATRGSDVFSMRISPDAGSVTDGAALRYPSAHESDVAIEIWIGNGSPPPLID